MHCTDTHINISFSPNHFLTDASYFGEGTPNQWLKRMSKNQEFADHIFIRLASECLNRRIKIHPVFREDESSLQTFEPSNSPWDSPTLYMLYYNDTRFTVGHYQVSFYKTYVNYSIFRCLA